MFAGFQLFLHHTRSGRHLQAVGGSKEMAQMSGLNVRRLTGASWMVAALAAALAVFPLLAQGSGSSSGTATPLLMEMVLATFLGAAFSRRRVVTIWGALQGVNIFWVGAIKGGLILLVLAASALQQKGSQS